MKISPNIKEMFIFVMAFFLVITLVEGSGFQEFRIFDWGIFTSRLIFIILAWNGCIKILQRLSHGIVTTKRQ